MRAFKILIVSIIATLTLTSVLSMRNFSQTYHLQYEGYKIYDIFIENEKQYQVFNENFKNTIDVISEAHNSQPLRVLLPPVAVLQVEQFLRRGHLKYRLINGNVAESIREESVAQRSIRSALRYDDIINFESYQRFDVINKYLDFLQVEYPKQVNIVELGNSYEGRPLRAIYITHPNSSSSVTRAAKPLILIDAGIHSREWISHATALYIINQLVESSSLYQEELLMYDWLIWPVVNPDGYEYSHEYDRLWRKTRQPPANNESTHCVGVDLNRNFDFRWAYVGSSNDPCDIDYHGPRAFSEPEAVALANLLTRVNATCRMYLTLHSYGNYLLYPWGYDKKLPPTWPYLDAVARAGSNAIRKATGTLYTVGSSTNVLYAASGASDDYAFAMANIPIVLCMELPSGGNGFDPPAKRILPLAAETWLGIRAMALEAYVNPLGNVANIRVSNGLLQLMLLIFILSIIH